MEQQPRNSRPVSEDRVLEACGERELPRMGTIEQVWETDPIPDGELASVASHEVANLELSDVPEGGQVAVGAGSRGIHAVDAIVRGVIEGLRDRGYEPFVFPAMGSHGGATAKGQREKLADYGITENATGCEIRATMETELLGHTPDREVPVRVDANAAAADAIVPVNRVKPHTDFSGEVESGLSKMLVIGIGKQRGAKTAHEWAMDWSFRQMIPEITEQIIERAPVAGGIAVVEDEHDETDIVEGVPPAGFLDREAELLETAYENLPTLPFEDLHVLLVDQMGKDISGSGMDTNVIGRLNYGPEPAPETPEIDRIYVRSLTEASHGNAAGVGTADLVHGDLQAAIDPEPMFINTLTSSCIRGARVPPAVETDRAGLVAALSTIGIVPAEEARVARVTDTMRLQRFHASEPLLAAAREREDLRVVAEASEIEFESGDLAADSPGLYRD